MAEVSEKIAVRSAEQQLLDKTFIKGTSYEDLVHDQVAAIVAPLGDLAEQIGRTAGCDGNQAGDELVTLNLDDTLASTARVVLELKDRKLGMAAIQKELDAAISNRDALVGVAVFSRDEHNPAGCPFTYHGNKAIVVYDKETLDDNALRLALMWARWVARRQLVEQGDDIEPDRIADLVDDARRSLDRLATIRRCHTQAKRKIDEASNQVGDLVADIQATLDALDGGSAGRDAEPGPWPGSARNPSTRACRAAPASEVRSPSHQRHDSVVARGADMVGPSRSS